MEKWTNFTHIFHSKRSWIDIYLTIDSIRHLKNLRKTLDRIFLPTKTINTSSKSHFP